MKGKLFLLSFLFGVLYCTAIYGLSVNSFHSGMESLVYFTNTTGSNSSTKFVVPYGAEIANASLRITAKKTECDFVGVAMYGLRYTENRPIGFTRDKKAMRHSKPGNYFNRSDGEIVDWSIYAGYTPDDVVDCATYSDNRTMVYFKDMRVGYSWADRWHKCADYITWWYIYTGYTPEDVVGMALHMYQRLHVYYSDSTTSYAHYWQWNRASYYKANWITNPLRGASGVIGCGSDSFRGSLMVYYEGGIVDYNTKWLDMTHSEKFSANWIVHPGYSTITGVPSEIRVTIEEPDLIKDNFEARDISKNWANYSITADISDAIPFEGNYALKFSDSLGKQLTWKNQNLGVPLSSKKLRFAFKGTLKSKTSLVFEVKLADDSVKTFLIGKSIDEPVNPDYLMGTLNPLVLVCDNSWNVYELDLGENFLGSYAVTDSIRATNFGAGVSLLKVEFYSSSGEGINVLQLDDFSIYRDHGGALCDFRFGSPTITGESSVIYDSASGASYEVFVSFKDALNYIVKDSTKKGDAEITIRAQSPQKGGGVLFSELNVEYTKREAVERKVETFGEWGKTPQLYFAMAGKNDSVKLKVPGDAKITSAKMKVKSYFDSDLAGVAIYGYGYNTDCRAMGYTYQGKTVYSPYGPYWTQCTPYQHRWELFAGYSFEDVIDVAMYWYYYGVPYYTDGKCSRGSWWQNTSAIYDVTYLPGKTANDVIATASKRNGASVIYYRDGTCSWGDGGYTVVGKYFSLWERDMTYDITDIVGMGIHHDDFAVAYYKQGVITFNGDPDKFTSSVGNTIPWVIAPPFQAGYYADKVTLDIYNDGTDDFNLTIKPNDTYILSGNAFAEALESKLTGYPENVEIPIVVETNKRGRIELSDIEINYTRPPLPPEFIKPDPDNTSDPGWVTTTIFGEAVNDIVLGISCSTTPKGIFTGGNLSTNPYTVEWSTVTDSYDSVAYYDLDFCPDSTKPEEEREWKNITPNQIQTEQGKTPAEIAIEYLDTFDDTDGFDASGIMTSADPGASGIKGLRFVNIGGAPGKWSKGVMCPLFFPFNNDAGNIINGALAPSGYKLADGSFKGTVKNYTIGKVGSAIKLDGVNDYIEVSNDTILDNINTLTLAGWVKITDYDFPSTGTHAIIMERENSFSMGIEENTGKFQVQMVLEGLSTGTWEGGEYQVPLNEWVHLSATWDGFKICFYANGKLVEMKRQYLGEARKIRDNNKKIVVGGRGAGSNLFEGELDEVCMIMNALSISEAEKLYENSFNTLFSETSMSMIRGESGGTNDLEMSDHESLVLDRENFVVHFEGRNNDFSFPDIERFESISGTKWHYPVDAPVSWVAQSVNSNKVASPRYATYPSIGWNKAYLANKTAHPKDFSVVFDIIPNAEYGGTIKGFIYKATLDLNDGYALTINSKYDSPPNTLVLSEMTGKTRKELYSCNTKKSIEAKKAYQIKVEVRDSVHNFYVDKVKIGSWQGTNATGYCGFFTEVADLENLVAEWNFNNNDSRDAGPRNLDMTSVSPTSYVDSNRTNLGRSAYFAGRTASTPAGTGPKIENNVNETVGGAWDNAWTVDGDQVLVVNLWANLQLQGNEDPTGSQERPIFNIADASINDDWGEFTITYQTTNVLYFWNYWSSRATTISDHLDKWHMITCVITKEYAQLYVDALSRSKGNHSRKVGGIPRGYVADKYNEPIRIGYGERYNSFFNGMIDQITVYNRLLSDNEIRNLYETGMKRIDTKEDSVCYFDNFSMLTNTAVAVGDGLHFYFRKDGADEYSVKLFGSDGTNRSIGLSKIGTGAFDYSVPFYKWVDDEKIKFTVAALDGNIKVYANNLLYINYPDTNYSPKTNARMGFRKGNTNTCFVDNVQIQKPSVTSYKWDLYDASFGIVEGSDNALLRIRSYSDTGGYSGFTYLKRPIKINHTPIFSEAKLNPSPFGYVSDTFRVSAFNLSDIDVKVDKECYDVMWYVMATGITFELARTQTNVEKLDATLANQTSTVPIMKNSSVKAYMRVRDFYSASDWMETIPETYIENQPPIIHSVEIRARDVVTLKNKRVGYTDDDLVCTVIASDDDEYLWRIQSFDKTTINPGDDISIVPPSGKPVPYVDGNAVTFDLDKDGFPELRMR